MHMNGRLGARVRVVVLLGAVLLAGLGTARADNGRESARAHFRRAEKAFSLGKFQQALEQYEAAYDLQPLPGLLFNMGQCHKNLGNSQRAIFFYERYLEVAQDESRREMVESLIAEERERLGQAVPAAPSAGAPGAEPAIGALDVLEPPPTTSPSVASLIASPPAQVRAQVTSDGKRPHPLYKRWWVWAAAGVVAALATGTVLLVRADRSVPGGSLGVIDGR
jgi:hypothetical protein